MGTELFFASGTSERLIDYNLATWDNENNPLNVLVAYPFVRNWVNSYTGWPVKATILDSGAYSAWASGVEIDMDKLCEEARTGDWDEVVALDVIGNGEASLVNSLEMKKRGLTVIPVFHFGDSWEILAEYKKHFDRIGLSGASPQHKQFRPWLAQCFARAYPAKFHGFGIAVKDVLLNFPFYTVDTASWHTGIRFGRTLAMPGVRLPRITEAGREVYNIKFEISKYLELEAEVKDRWSKEFRNQGWSERPAAKPQKLREKVVKEPKPEKQLKQAKQKKVTSAASTS